jgi:hypothetical protein
LQLRSERNRKRIVVGIPDRQQFGGRQRSDRLAAVKRRVGQIMTIHAPLPSACGVLAEPGQDQTKGQRTQISPDPARRPQTLHPF